MFCAVSLQSFVLYVCNVLCCMCAGFVLKVCSVLCCKCAEFVL